MVDVLLAEDEQVLARNIGRALSRSGMSVRHAATASEARAHLSRRRFDLVVADISLGDGDGLDVISDAQDALGDTPVIVMTGQDSVANRARAEMLSAAVFLAKPFALSRLRELAAALTSGPETGPGRTRRGRSIVMYSHDTIGLGHMRRNSAIARGLVEIMPDVSVLMLVGCPAGIFFESCPGVDYVKLPSLSKLGRGMFQPGSLRLATDTLLRMRRSVIEGIVANLKPDVFLVDHEPSGVLGELEPLLDRLRASGRTRAVLGLRDILDTPDAVARNWAKAGNDRVIADLYDNVLIYGDPAFYPSARAYRLPASSEYCGVVTTSRRESRRDPVGPPRKVLVAGGGGRDAYPLIEAAIEAQASLPSRRRPEMTVVTGPLMDEELQTEILARAAPVGARVFTHVPDLTDLMVEADLLVTMTGYNSINEALAVGCPILTVPRLGPSAEQRMRAERLAALGLADVIPREELSPAALARRFAAPPFAAAPGAVALDGVRRAAERLGEIMLSASSDEEAARALSS